MTGWKDAITRNIRSVAAGTGIVIVLVLILLAAGVLPGSSNGYKSPHAITSENPSLTTVACSGNVIVVDYRGGPNAAGLTNISVWVDTMQQRSLNLTIGSQEMITPVAGSEVKEHRVIVASTFTDGEMVIDQDVTLTCP